MIVAVEMKRQGWTEARLAQQRKGDPLKLAWAARLRWETTLTMGWIAHGLPKGTRKL